MWNGAYTALVTPFTREGAVDWTRLRELVEFQIDAGIDGLVPVGTTGESPTLDYEEHRRVIEEVVATARGRVPVIAGTGGNSTQEAIELTRHAQRAGVQATLQVTPYYNKPTPDGLRAHFTAVAEIGLPVVLYNVPGRTACEIPVEVVADLARHPMIVAVKEAGGSVDRVSRILDACDIAVLSGDDALTLPMMSVGAVGVISVASNVIPGGIAGLVRAATADRWAEARALHRRYYRLFNALFLETNPQPVKAALALMGRIEETYRLPLCPVGADTSIYQPVGIHYVAAPIILGGPDPMARRQGVRQGLDDVVEVPATLPRVATLDASPIHVPLRPLDDTGARVLARTLRQSRQALDIWSGRKVYADRSTRHHAFLCAIMRAGILDDLENIELLPGAMLALDEQLGADPDKALRPDYQAITIGAALAAVTAEARP